MAPALARQVLAEFVGTAVLVFVAVGSAVAGIDQLGATGVALAFGLVLLGLAYALGPVSGCHVNPAVTLAVLLSRGMAPAEAVAYWVAQFAGRSQADGHGLRTTAGASQRGTSEERTAARSQADGYRLRTAEGASQRGRARSGPRRGVRPTGIA